MTVAMAATHIRSLFVAALAAGALLLSATVVTDGAEAASGLEAALLDDARDGGLDSFSLLEGALIASGVSDEEQLRGYAAACWSLADALEDELTHVAHVHEGAEVALEFLHRELLSGEYQADCTELDRLLEEGHYNCVSATVAYHCLCRAVGLEPIAVATTTHVRSRFAGSDVFDVETTCGDWFSIARRDSSAQYIRIELQSTRLLTDTQLLGKIYYNRGVSLLEAKQFAAALELLQRGLWLDPQDASALENLLAAINNWALAECDAGRYEAAAALITDGLAAYPRHQPFLANDLHIHQQWALELCRRQQFGTAVRVLDEAHQRRPDVELFDRGRFVIHGQWAAALLEAERLEELWQLVRATQLRFPDRPQATDEQRRLIQQAIAECQRIGDWTRGSRLLDLALELWPNDAEFLEQQGRLTAEAL